MAKLWRTLLRRTEPDSEASRYDVSSLYDLYEQSIFGNAFAFPMWGGGGYGVPAENIENSFQGYTYAAYKSDSVVFACVLARMLLFTEARFQWQRINAGRPGDLFGNADLKLLEKPWPNGTTGELLGRMEQDVSLAGNFYAVNEGDRLRRLRPDWVTIILSAPPELAARSDVIGYHYTPGVSGMSGKTDADSGNGRDEFYLVDEVCHWSPIPDPVAQYRGMSWLTPVLREIQADKAATQHKLKFFQNGATLQAIVSLKESVTEEQFKAFVESMDAAHRGVDNAYKTLYVGGGADVTLVGRDLQQMDFKATQGAGETRIAAAAGVPPIIVGLSEGLDSATYSNYNSARRKFADGWARPMWRSACAALEPILTSPGGTTRLWYDDRDVAFLREDVKDQSIILKEQVLAMEAGVRAGFDPDTVVAACMTGDLSLLKHTGLVSVQLLPPGGGSPVTSPFQQPPVTTPNTFPKTGAPDSGGTQAKEGA